MREKKVVRERVKNYGKARDDRSKEIEREIRKRKKGESEMSERGRERLFRSEYTGGGTFR